MNTFYEICVEVNMNKIFNHPCIMKIEDYCYSSESQEDKFYMAMEKGENIRNAYKNRKITIRQITSDILSAIAFLHRHGFGHFDIKMDNIIFHDGVAKLIDFGLADKCKKFYDVNGNVDYYNFNNNIGFTYPYKDPQYSPHHLNSIKSDLFGFAMSLYDICTFDGEYRCSRIIPDLHKINNHKIRNLIKKCFLPWDKRPSAEELLKHNAIVRHYDLSPNECKFNQKYLQYNIETNSDLRRKSIYYACILWLLNISQKYRILLEQFFTIVYLFKIVLRNYFTEYETDGKKQKIQLVLVACYAIVLSKEKTQFKNNKSITDFCVEICSKAYNKQEFYDMCFTIIERYGIMIYNRTYFDIITNKEEIFPFIQISFQCSYGLSFDVFPSETIKGEYPIEYKFNEYDRFIKDKFPLDEMYKIVKRRVISDVIFPLPTIDETEYEKELLNSFTFHDSTMRDFNIVLTYRYLFKNISDKVKSKIKTFSKDTNERKRILEILESN